MQWKSRARCLGAKNERGDAEGRIGRVVVGVAVAVAVVVVVVVGVGVAVVVGVAVAVNKLNHFAVEVRKRVNGRNN